MSTFQIVILSIFMFFVVVGFLGFSGILPLFNVSDRPDGIGGTIVVWGTIPKEYFELPLRSLNDKNKDFYVTEYKEISTTEFDQKLIEALASGVGPDLVVLPQDLIIRYEDKIFPIPYESFPLRTFKDIFIEEGELYTKAEHLLAFPISIDPLVMYWNRDIFSDGGISRPPKSWSEFFALVPKITKTDDAFNIRQATIAFGEYWNVNHAKDILGMLVLQAGNPIVETLSDGIRVVLRDQRGFVTPPAQSSLRFYTEFSNPVKVVYSWNRSLPPALDFFVSGDLATYFGYASEHTNIRLKGPHLNFDVALMPQTEDSERNVTFGRVYGVALLKRSTNPKTAFLAMTELSGKDFIRAFSEASKLPPVRRDLLEEKSTDAVRSVFYDSALISKAWLDPNPKETEEVFQAMIEDVVSGRAQISSAVSRGHQEILELFPK